MNLTPVERGENDIRNPAEPIISESVNRARMALGSTPNSSPTPPMYPTKPREDEGGVIHTMHPMIWDLDSWDDPDSHWAGGATF